jgi:FtsP/CotA-like multicopper oxidase with cupredoxin domain
VNARRLVVTAAVAIAITMPLSTVTMAVTVAGMDTSATALPATVVATKTPCDRVRPPSRQQQCDRSLLPAQFAMTQMGYPDFGGGAKDHSHGGIGVDRLKGPAGAPTRTYTITAAMGVQSIGGVDRQVMTFNGTTPGPTLTVTQGDLLEVTLVNKDIVNGVTIHWHGVDVPGRDDGVAGVTQDAVLPGETFVYHFVVPDAGTYWYHSHQDSVTEVGMGLLGALVVLPREAPADAALAGATDVVAVVHTYGLTTTLNGQTDPPAIPQPLGTFARVRVVNGDNGPALIAASVSFRVVAIDGTDISGPTDLTDTYVDIPAGGRFDLLVPVTDRAVRVGVLSGPSIVIGSGDAPALAAHTRFDALAYGTPGGSAAASAELGTANRDFTYRIGSRSGFLDGKRGTWFTINAGIIPQVPMFMVKQGDVVRFRIVNTTALVHPMHLHGHHALVLSRNGVKATGAAWWVDSLQVDPGESYDLLLRADNPGVWMFHCHNLPHARAGLMTHLMYEGVSTPFRIGRVNARLTNSPE